MIIFALKINLKKKSIFKVETFPCKKNNLTKEIVVWLKSIR